jgi:predicted RNase H-like nuclease
MSISIVGFDSAWCRGKAGAICAIGIDAGGNAKLEAPRVASFQDALAFIDNQRQLFRKCLVAIDQPTIVPNETRMRQVERVVASVISYAGGGVQPAFRRRLGLFDDDAPIWEFKRTLGAIDEPECSRDARCGVFLIEVFPALALLAFGPQFFGRNCAPKYNPANKLFRPTCWTNVITTIDETARHYRIERFDEVCGGFKAMERPRKSHQDQIDAMICALVGFHWLTKSRDRSIIIGDLKTGYIVAPRSDAFMPRLRAAADRNGVAVA